MTSQVTTQQGTRTLQPPSDTPAYMYPAWISCLRLAFDDPAILQLFRENTGNNWRLGPTYIDRMIDEACGADWDFIEQFVAWFNVNIWSQIGGDGD
jgi:hypothetical protein